MRYRIVLLSVVLSLSACKADVLAPITKPYVPAPECKRGQFPRVEAPCTMPFEYPEDSV